MWKRVMYQSLCKDQRLLVVSIHTEYTAFQATNIELTIQIHIIIEFMTVFYLGTDHLTCRGGVMVFCSVQKFFFGQHELEYFFSPQNLTLGYMTKTLNQIFFFLHQNQNIFFSNIGNQNIFLEKNHNPPPPGS